MPTFYRRCVLHFILSEYFKHLGGFLITACINALVYNGIRVMYSLFTMMFLSCFLS